MKRSTKIYACITIFYALAMLILSIGGENYLAIIGWVFALVFISYCFYYDFIESKESDAIEFAKWCKENYSMEYYQGQWYWQKRECDSPTQQTTQQLYLEFKSR